MVAPQEYVNIYSTRRVVREADSSMAKRWVFTSATARAYIDKKKQNLNPLTGFK